MRWDIEWGFQDGTLCHAQTSVGKVFPILVKELEGFLAQPTEVQCSGTSGFSGDDRGGGGRAESWTSKLAMSALAKDNLMM